jgi:AcrR family transcriptional regulator
MNVEIETISPSERERVLRAMTELCAEQGYEQTSAEEVIERAGVSAEQFAEMFADREECLVAAINAVMGEVLSTISSSYSPDSSEWDSGILGMKATLELMAANPSFAYLSYITSRQMGPPSARQAIDSGRTMLVAMIERLWEYSSIEVQPAKTARGVLGGVEAVVRGEIVAGRTEELPRLLPDFVYAVTVPFLGQEEALRLSRRAREILRGSAWE